MEFLDPTRQARHRVMLWVGYVLVTGAILIGTLILLYLSYGFAIGKNGQVIQNGLVFFSSHPGPAQIYLNGKLNSAQTNSRVTMPAGIYHVQLQRTGYRVWQRTIEVEGGDVQHFDYPLLIPKKLSSKQLGTYAAPPALATQSPDHRWLITQKPGSLTGFNIYDLKPRLPTSAELNLPDGLLTRAATPGENWQLEEWADDNKHLVLQHNFDGRSEFILIDRTDVAKSQNLNRLLAANPAKLTLLNKKYDQYYLYDADGRLQRAGLAAPAPVPVLDHVLAYQSYASDTLLYATDAGAPAGKAQVRLKVGDATYPVRTLPAGGSYLLDLAKYSGTLYIVAGASNADRAYIYKDPLGQLKSLPNHALVPSQVLHIVSPNFVGFSANAQFIVAEGGNQFGVYDIENQKGYSYTAPQPIDAPQQHAAWIDGDRLAYVSQGRLLIFDYDDTNQQLLTPASPAYRPAFAPDFKFVYTLTPDALNQTALLTPADQ